MSAASFTARAIIAAPASRLEEPVAIGPVLTDASLAKLRAEIIDAGWSIASAPYGTVSYMTAAEWRRQHAIRRPR